MGNVMQERIAVAHNVILLPFQATNITDAAGNAAAIQADSLEYVIGFKGSIFGISVRHNADLTGGVITWRPTINGTANTTLTVLTDDTNQQAYKSIAARRVRFAAGARIGVDWTKTGTVAPETTDAVIALLLLLEGIDL